MLHYGVLSILYTDDRNEAKKRALRGEDPWWLDVVLIQVSWVCSLLELHKGRRMRLSGETAGVDHQDHGEFMCPHLPILARLQGFADCMHYRKPPDVVGLLVLAYWGPPPAGLPRS